jgi:hypothetical protein
MTNTPKKVRLACRRGHELTIENVYLTKAGYRQCRACHQLWRDGQRAANEVKQEERAARQRQIEAMRNVGKTAFNEWFARNMLSPMRDVSKEA